jgi:hypothetical protein
MEDTPLLKKIFSELWLEERKVQENPRRAGLTVLEGAVHEQKYPTDHGQKMRKIENQSLKVYQEEIGPFLLLLK